MMRRSRGGRKEARYARAMGREPEALRKCLEATERGSIEKIYRFDFQRFTQARKSVSRRKEKKLPLGRPTPSFWTRRSLI
jgi:hypothetical protein